MATKARTAVDTKKKPAKRTVKTPPAKPVKAVEASKAPKASKATKPAKPVKALKPAQAPQASRQAKKPPQSSEVPKPRIKLVRDSFTMPREEFELIAQLKARALNFKRPTKKSELLRAGLQVLSALSDAQLHAALDALRPLKAGRPKHKH